MDYTRKLESNNVRLLTFELNTKTMLFVFLYSTFGYRTDD